MIPKMLIFLKFIYLAWTSFFSVPHSYIQLPTWHLHLDICWLLKFDIFKTELLLFPLKPAFPIVFLIAVNTKLLASSGYLGVTQFLSIAYSTPGLSANPIDSAFQIII